MSVVVRPYQSYEAGKRLPQAEGLHALAEAGIDINWLLTGVGQMRRDAPEAGQPPLDEQLLAMAIQLVEDWLTANRRVLTAERKAKAAATLYAMALDAADDGKPQVDARQAAHILKLVG